MTDPSSDGDTLESMVSRERRLTSAEVFTVDLTDRPEGADPAPAPAVTAATPVGSAASLRPGAQVRPAAPAAPSAEAGRPAAPSAEAGRPAAPSAEAGRPAAPSAQAPTAQAPTAPAPPRPTARAGAGASPAWASPADLLAWAMSHAAAGVDRDPEPAPSPAAEVTPPAGREPVSVVAAPVVAAPVAGSQVAAAPAVEAEPVADGERRPAEVAEATPATVEPPVATRRPAVVEAAAAPVPTGPAEAEAPVAQVEPPVLGAPVAPRRVPQALRTARPTGNGLGWFDRQSDGSARGPAPSAAVPPAVPPRVSPAVAPTVPAAVAPSVPAAVAPTVPAAVALGVPVPDAPAPAEPAAVPDAHRPGPAAQPVAEGPASVVPARVPAADVPVSGLEPVAPATLPVPVLPVPVLPVPVPVPVPFPGPLPVPAVDVIDLDPRDLVVDLRGSEPGGPAPVTPPARVEPGRPAPTGADQVLGTRPLPITPASRVVGPLPPATPAVSAAPPRAESAVQPLVMPAAAKRLQPKIVPPASFTLRTSEVELPAIPEWTQPSRPDAPPAVGSQAQEDTRPTDLLAAVPVPVDLVPVDLVPVDLVPAVPAPQTRAARRLAAVGREPAPKHGASTSTGDWTAPRDGPARPRAVRRTGRRVLLALSVLAAGVAVVAAGAVAFGDRVPRGTTIGGVDVGGRSRAAAIEALTAAVAGAARPVPVQVSGRSAALDPATAGLSVNPAQSVDAVLGSRFDLGRLWRDVVGGGPAPVLPAPRRETLVAALQDLARTVDVPAVEGGVTFAGGVPQRVTPVTGSALDVPAAADLVSSRWLDRRTPLQLPARVHQPRVAPAEIERALSALARPAVSGPLAVVVGSRTVTVPAAALAPALRVAPSAAAPATLDLSVDGVALREAVLAAAPGLETAPVDARIVLKGQQPTVVPAVNGVQLDPAGLATAARAALLSPQRRAVVTPVTAAAKLTTAAATALGVKEKVSTFSTVLTSNAVRTSNLRIAARTVNGTLVLPGATFSLNSVLGRRTPEKGYQQAPVINGSRLGLDYGGGVSQLATTIYNNVFFAGLTDVHHMAHSFYISRYPEGREATVSFPTVDLVWRNDSPYAVLVQADVTTTVNVSFWSTKVFQVVAEKGPRTNPRAPRTVYDAKPGCVPQGANPGFDVTVRRKLYQDGALVRTQTWTTSYQAEDHVVCGPKPASATTPAD